MLYLTARNFSYHFSSKSYQKGHLRIHVEGHRFNWLMSKRFVVANVGHTPSTEGRFLKLSRHAFSDSKSSRSSGSSGRKIGASCD